MEILSSLQNLLLEKQKVISQHKNDAQSLYRTIHDTAELFRSFEGQVCGIDNSQLTQSSFCDKVYAVGITLSGFIESIIQASAEYANNTWRDNDARVHLQTIVLSRFVPPAMLISALYGSMQKAQHTGSHFNSLYNGIGIVGTWIMECCTQSPFVFTRFLSLLICREGNESPFVDTVSIEEGVRGLFSLPTLLANATQGQIPPALARDEFLTRIARAWAILGVEKANIRSLGDAHINQGLRVCAERLCVLGGTTMLYNAWLSAAQEEILPLLQATVGRKVVASAKNDTRKRRTSSLAQDKETDTFTAQKLRDIFSHHCERGIWFLNTVPSSHRTMCITNIVRSGAVESIKIKHSLKSLNSKSKGALSLFTNPLFIAFGPAVSALWPHTIRGTIFSGQECTDVERAMPKMLEAANALAVALVKEIPIKSALTKKQIRSLLQYLAWPAQERFGKLTFLGNSEEVLEITFEVAPMEEVLPAMLWLSTWSDPVFVGISDRQLQASLTRAILFAFKYLPDSFFGTNSSLTVPVMEGVQARLNESDSRIRRLGMRVAQEFSRRVANCVRAELEEHRKTVAENGDATEQDQSISPEDITPIAFDCGDLDSDSQYSVASYEEIDIGISEVPQNADQSEEAFVIRHDAIAQEDSGYQSDDSLPPFSLPDESDHKEISEQNDESNTQEAADEMDRGLPPPPAFLRDALAGLADRKDYKRVSVAIRSVPGLIRKICQSPWSRRELHEQVESVIRKLLAADNYFGLPMFNSLRREAIVASIVGSPLGAVRFLGKVVFAQEQMIATRLNVLDCLVEAIQQLSGITAATLISDDSKASQNNAQLTTNVKSSSHKVSKETAVVRMADGSIRARTKHKRHERLSQAKVRETHVNRFAAIAGEFFFPFIARLNDPTAGVDAFGDDTLFLASILHYLAVVVECARLSPNVHRMAASLLQLLWLVRLHDDSGVRRAVISALGAVVNVVFQLKMSFESSVTRRAQGFGVRGSGLGTDILFPQPLISEIDDKAADRIKKQDHEHEMSITPGRVTNRIESASKDLVSSVNNTGASYTFGGDILEATAWLRASVENDPDTVCREMALQLLRTNALQQILHQTTMTGFT